jgi:hypothetical protein
MIKISLFLLMIFLVILTFAQNYMNEKVYFNKDKINVYDKYGDLVETIKKDYFDKNKTNDLDSYGNKKSSSKQDNLIQKRQIFKIIMIKLLYVACLNVLIKII